MMNLMSKTASKALRKAVGAKSETSRLKCKLTLVVKRIVLEGTEQGHVSVELSRGLKAACTAPMPTKDGIVVLTNGSQELSIISTIERTAENVRCEKIFKLSVKAISTDQKGRKSDAECRVLGAIEIDVADFVGNGDPADVEQARTWSIPCRKGKRHITIETVCSARPVSTHKVVDDSEESSDIADISDGSDDANMLNLEQVFTGSDLMISALKFQSDSDYNSESDTSPAKAVSPPMLGIGGGLTNGVQRQITDGIRRKLSKPGVVRKPDTPSSDGRQAVVKGGVSDSPLNPVSLSVSRIQTARIESSNSQHACPLLKDAPKSGTNANNSAAQLNVTTAHKTSGLVANVRPATVCSPWSGRASSEAERNITGEQDRGPNVASTDEDLGVAMSEITSPKSAAAKEELFQTLKASLKVRESHVLELQSENARLQARLAQAEQDSDLARKAPDQRNKIDSNAGLTSTGSQDGSQPDAPPKLGEICARCEGLSADLHRQKTHLKEALEQARAQSLTIQQRDQAIRDSEASAAATASEVVRRKQRMEARLEEKEREVEQLTSKFEIADREMVLLESELKESERKNERLLKEVHDLQMYCNGLKNDFEDEVKRAELDANSRERDLKRRKNEDKERTVRHEDQMTQLQAEISATSIRVSRGEMQVQELRGERDRLRREVEMLKESKATAEELVKERDIELGKSREHSQQTEHLLSRVEEAYQKVCAELEELKIRLETSEKGRNQAGDQVHGLQAELEAEKIRNDNLQHLMAADEHKANKIRAELKTQIEEMDGLLAKERLLSLERGQEHQEGQSELEGLNQVLSKRVERLTAEQVAANQSKLVLEAHCQRLIEDVRSLKANMLSMETIVQSLESSEQKVQGHAQQLQLELYEVATDRDAQALRFKEQEEELRQFASTVGDLQSEVTKCAEEKKMLEDKLQALETERDHLLAQFENDKLLFQEEAQQQRGRERRAFGEELVSLKELCQQCKSHSEVIVQDARNAQVMLSSLSMDVESLLLLKEQGEEQHVKLNRDLAHTKDTIAQLKKICSRTEADLMKRQEALQETRDELNAVQQTNDELVEALARLRAENTTLHDAQERLRESEQTWVLERGKWQEEKTAWDQERMLAAEEKAQELERSLAEEEERQQQSDEARLRIQREMEEAKSLGGGAGGSSTGGSLSCPICAILQAQEDMLVKGLSAECALLDMLQQRFPLLTDAENQRIVRGANTELQRARVPPEIPASNPIERVAPCPSHKRRVSAVSATAWLKEQEVVGHINCGASDQEVVLADHSACSTVAEQAGVEIDLGGGSGEIETVETSRRVVQELSDFAEGECHVRIQELEGELRQVRADAELDASGA